MKYVIEKEEMSSSESYLQKIQSLQHSLSFLQKEHAETLSGLYKEIAKLQEKCTDLNFQLVQQQAYRNGESSKSLTESKLLIQEDKSSLVVQLEIKDKRIGLLETQLKSKQQKFNGDLQNAQRKIASLQVEIENKSSSIAYLTAQLNKVIKLQSNNVEEFSVVCPSPPVGTPIRRRSSRRKVLSPSASLDGFIHESESQEIIADYVLQSSLPKNNRERVSTSHLVLKHSIDDFPSWHNQKFLSKPRPSDYEDFILMSQPSDVVSKPSVQPLPPITTRSGKKLIEPSNAKKVIRNRPKATASACGEVEQIIKYNLAPDKPCGHGKNSLMKH